jgi:hypothetical protein
MCMLGRILHGSTSLRGSSAALREGRGEALQTLETEGQMIQRVMPDLMGLRNILVLNGEAHHCYREWRRPYVDKNSSSTAARRYPS